jgi:hypothetical protein
LSSSASKSEKSEAVTKGRYFVWTRNIAFSAANFTTSGPQRVRQMACVPECGVVCSCPILTFMKMFVNCFCKHHARGQKESSASAMEGIEAFRQED